MVDSAKCIESIGKVILSFLYEFWLNFFIRVKFVFFPIDHSYVHSLIFKHFRKFAHISCGLSQTFLQRTKSRLYDLNNNSSLRFE